MLNPELIGKVQKEKLWDDWQFVQISVRLNPKEQGPVEKANGPYNYLKQGIYNEK